MEGAAPVRIQLLGRFGMEAGGRTVVDGTGPYGPARALVKALILAPDRMLHREQVLQTLWPRLPSSAAGSNLRQCMHHLRSACAANGAAMPVEVHGNLLAFASGVWFDIDEFRRRAELALEVRTDAAAFEEALALYRGALLTDDPYDDALFQLRETLAGLRLRLLIGLAHLLMARGHDAAAVARAQEALVSDDTHEEAHRILMRLYARAGQRDRAMRQFARCTEVLRRELGVEPAAETVAVHGAIIEGRLQPAVNAPGGAFVGREPELRVLRSMLEDADGGRGGIAVIGGDPGIGKTRLAEEFAAYARLRGARVVWSRCSEEDDAPAFWPWIQVIRALGEDWGGGAEMDAGPLSRLLPELGGRAGDASARTGEEARFQLFQAVAAFLRRQARASTTVIVFDDLHGARPPALRLLESLSREIRDGRLVIAACHRTGVAAEALTTTFAELAREPRNRRFTLAGLSRDDVRRLIVAETSGAIVSPELVDALYATTEGNPLFVGEMLRLLGDAPDRAPPLPVPDSIADVIRARLANLMPECRLVLAVASVIGRGFGVDLLHRMDDLAGMDLGRQLAGAECEGLIEALDEGTGRYRFSHALVHQTLYTDQPAATRAARHQHVGEALEALGGRGAERLAELVHHFVRAAEGLGPVCAMKAQQYAAEAAAEALKALAYEDAADLYDTALRAFERLPAPDPERRCDLLLALGRAQHLAGNPAARETSLMAADAARDIGSGQRLARAALIISGPWDPPYGGDEAIIALMRKALRELDKDDWANRSRLLSRLTRELIDSPASERRLLSEQAVEAGQRSGDPLLHGAALLSRLSAQIEIRDVQGRFKEATRVLRIGEQTGSAELRMEGHLWRADALVRMADMPAAERELAAVDALAEATRSDAYRWVVSYIRSMHALLAGRFSEVEGLIGQAVEIGRRANAPDVADAAGAQLVMLRREQGRVAELHPAIESFAARFPLIVGWRAALAFSLLEQDREAEARWEFRALADQFFHGLADHLNGENGIFTLALLSEVCAGAGDADGASVLYDLLEGTSGQVVTYGVVSMGSADRSLGLLAAARSRPADAISHFERAIEVNAHIKSPPWLAWTQLQYGQLLLGLGENAEAREMLRAATTAGRDLGMVRLLAQAGTVAATGIDAPTRRP